MIPLIEFPELVQRYAPYFKEVFSAEAFIEFERYITGLLVSENKTIEGMNQLFITESRNQSSLNRLLTESPYSLEHLNRKRLELLASLPGTQMKPKGVLSLDDTLLTHYGQDFEKIANLWDHVTESYVWAHDLVTVHYSDDETDYPVVFQLWEPVDIQKLEEGLRKAKIAIKASKETLKTSQPQKWRSYLTRLWQRQQKKHPELQELYNSKLTIAQKLLKEWFETHPDEKRPVTFDSWFTKPSLCNFLDQTLKVSYVGMLSGSDKIELQTGERTLKDFAEQLKQEHLEHIKSAGKPVFEEIKIPFKRTHEVYYSYCNTHHLRDFGKQRLVINYRKADLSDNPNFLISNCLVWQAAGITRIRRHRWSVEVYHEEGKAEGLDQYQLRSFSAIQRHVAFVAVVYSLLRAAQHDPDLGHSLQRQLKILIESPASWRRASQAQSLWCLALFISTGLAQGLPLTKIMAPLFLTFQ